MYAEIIMSKKQRVEQFIKQFMKKNRVPGLAVGMIHEHQIIAAEGYGVKNIESQEPVNKNTLFHMASISKTFVACAVMQLVEQGAVLLDSKISDLIPYFQMDDERYCEITVRHVLNHTSGMPDVEDYEWHSPVYEEYALEHYVRGLRNKRLKCVPGEQFHYSNIGYEILGHLVSRISGLSFESYMKEYLLNPIGMRCSDFYKPNVDERQLASPHIANDEDHRPCLSNVFPYHRAHSPSSTLLSSAQEMCKAALVHLQTFAAGKEFTPILKQTSYQQMWTPHTVPNGTGEGNAGYGWFIGDYRRANTISHSGMDTGFCSKFILLPETGSAVILMCNADYAELEALSRNVMDIVLED